MPDESNCFQISQGVRVVYSDAEKKVVSLLINGNLVQEDKEYSICLEEYHYKNSVMSLNMTAEELGSSKAIATSVQSVLEEYLSSHQLLDAHIEGRWTFQ